MQAAAATTSPIEAEVLRIQGLLQAGRNEDAVAAAETLRRTVPENRDVLYMLAVGQRYLRRLPGGTRKPLARLEIEPIRPIAASTRSAAIACSPPASRPRRSRPFSTPVNLNASLPGS